MASACFSLGLTALGAVLDCRPTTRSLSLFCLIPLAQLAYEWLVLGQDNVTIVQLVCMAMLAFGSLLITAFVSTEGKYLDGGAIAERRGRIHRGRTPEGGHQYSLQAMSGGNSTVRGDFGYRSNSGVAEMQRQAIVDEQRSSMLATRNGGNQA